MKKGLLLFFILTFLFLNVQGLFAQENSSTKEKEASSVSAQIKTIDYALPYPGLLPDSPLYFLKALRDRMISFFISDPLKKAEFNLLMADARLNATQYLFAKGEAKYSLAETTVSKGENYFEQALDQAIQAKKLGQPAGDIAQKLYQASFKHQQVIKSLEDKTKSDLKQRLIAQEKRVEIFQKRAKEIMPK